jgi:hypothetical protein
MVELPDDVTQHTNPGREILKAFAIAGYWPQLTVRNW